MIAMTEAAPPLVVDVQLALADSDINDAEEPPSAELLSEWANRAYAAIKQQPNEVTLRLVGEQEMVALNRDYRSKPAPTNVLSFPFEAPAGVDVALLGDVVICHSVIVAEALEQAKSVHAHYAHMVTHGLLHLCGYDHQDDVSADQMESLEISILADQGFANPYL